MPHEASLVDPWMSLMNPNLVSAIGSLIARKLQSSDWRTLDGTARFNWSTTVTAIYNPSIARFHPNTPCV